MSRVLVPDLASCYRFLHFDRLSILYFVSFSVFLRVFSNGIFCLLEPAHFLDTTRKDTLWLTKRLITSAKATGCWRTSLLFLDKALRTHTRPPSLPSLPFLPFLPFLPSLPFDNVSHQVGHQPPFLFLFVFGRFFFLFLISFELSL